MIQQRPCVNGILAAVLSASILPIHGALAKEKTPATHKTAPKHAAKKTDKQETPKEDPMKSDAGSGAAAPSTPQ